MIYSELQRKTKTFTGSIAANLRNAPVGVQFYNVDGSTPALIRAKTRPIVRAETPSAWAHSA